MLLCASLWSIAGIFIKLIPWHPFVIAGFRSLLSAGVIAVYMLFTHQKFVFNKFNVFTGIVLMLTFTAFITANKLTTSANAIVLQFTTPIYILIFSAVFYHQRFRISDYLTVGFTLFGISLFFFDGLSTGHMLGNFVALLCGLFMSGMFLTTSHADNESRMSGILLGHLFTAAVCLPALFFTPVQVTTQAVLSILALGIFQLGIPYILYGMAVRHCPPLACSLISVVEPLLNPVWVFIFAGEAPGVYALIGGVIVIATVTLWCVKQSQLQQASDQRQEK
jgi:drug/metabolite transporter (DMT)-like permease